MKVKNEMNIDWALKHCISVKQLSAKGEKFSLEADEAECLALARNHNLLTVESFSAYYQISSWKLGAIKVKGHFQAEIVQECVITLSPIEREVKQNVQLLFVPEGSKLLKSDYQYMEGSGELLIDVNAPDFPEIYKGGFIEIGAVTEELFELALDPYPRCEKAKFQYNSNNSLGSVPKVEDSPFSVLKKLKD